MSEPLDQILDATVAEQAVTDTLKLWMPTYLAHVARLRNFPGLGADDIATPRDYVTVNEVLDLWPEDQLPTIYVIATGLADEPVKDGDGWYRCKWALGVAAVVEANNRTNTDRLAKLYTAAIWGALLQHRSLGGRASGVDLLDATFDGIPNDKRRSLVAARSVFEVQIDQVVNIFEGLDAPIPGDPPPEPDQWLTVKEDGASVDITHKEE